jgi:hypothetical protein
MPIQDNYTCLMAKRHTGKKIAISIPSELWHFLRKKNFQTFTLQIFINEVTVKIFAELGKLLRLIISFEWVKMTPVKWYLLSLSLGL